MCCFVILLLFKEMQMSMTGFSAIPHLRLVKRLTYNLDDLDPENRMSQNLPS